MMIEISKLLPMVVVLPRSIIVADAIGGSFENSNRDDHANSNTP